MPLTSDPETLKISERVLAQFQGIFGKHAGYRPSNPPFDLMYLYLCLSPSSTPLADIICLVLRETQRMPKAHCSVAPSHPAPPRNL